MGQVSKLGGFWRCRKLTVPLIKFLVYWTVADLDREAMALKDKIVKKLGTGILGQLAGIPQVLLSEVTFGIASSAAELVRNRPIYYQHLISARKALKEAESSSNLLSATWNLSSSYVGNWLRTTKDFWQ